MKKMAVIPWDDAYFRDQIFNLKNIQINRDDALKIFVSLQECLCLNGWEFHTIDMYSDISQIDSIIFFTFDTRWYKIILKNHLENKTIYIAFEPPIVDKNHSNSGINKLMKYFKYILTWNDEIVDNIRIFKFMYPYYFHTEKSDIPLEKKKLLVNISGNKQSNEENELYSEREKVITFFDNSNDFELYGSNWSKDIHPSYMGLANQKKDIYHRFKFALCLENMTNIDGYITEKILDCFCAGIVPIYWGARNIDDYIPKECYVPYSDFGNLNEMEQYLSEMTQDEYQSYIDAADMYLKSEQATIFTPERLGETLIKLSNSNELSFLCESNFKLYEINQYKIKVLHKIRSFFK